MSQRRHNLHGSLALLGVLLFIAALCMVSYVRQPHPVPSSCNNPDAAFSDAGVVRCFNAGN